jgi:hypothetical protein
MILTYENTSADNVTTSDKHTKYVPYPPEKGKHHGAWIAKLNSPQSSVNGNDILTRGTTQIRTRHKITFRVLEKNALPKAECETLM